MKLNEKEVVIELIQGVEGPCLIVNGYRLVGPKPWGGGRVTRTWKTTVGAVKETISAKRIKLYESISQISG